MAWIRLSDDYYDHPKFRDLSDGAFRLWHQSLGFCRKYKTDGLLPIRTVREFKAYSPKRMGELLVPCEPGFEPLWHEVEGFGIKFHNYLKWNPSKDEENERRYGSKDQMRQLREDRRRVKGVAPVSTNTASAVSTNTLEHLPSMLRDGKGGDRDLEVKKELSEESRAGKFLEVTYPALYSKYRNGARLALMGNAVEFQSAVRLMKQWDDARLEKLAALVLTTDDDWISSTDRGFKIFSLKASWADDRLAAWEKSQEATQ